MKPDPRFSNHNLAFWANVRAIGETVGYTDRKTKSIYVPTQEDLKTAMTERSLQFSHLFNKAGRLTNLGQRLLQYFEYRANVLNHYVEPRLMKMNEAKKQFDILRRKLKPKCPLPLNKQKGDKKKHAYLTGIVNMIIESHTKGLSCDYDPRCLTTITKNEIPLRTLARRIDGAFPGTVNPIAIWEIKEYYFTTTFGSRIADGVYETLLDGMELVELKKSESIFVHHTLIIDAYDTWWTQGRSYLCRIIDAMNMGYIDEVLFGREVVDELPKIVESWVTKHHQLMEKRGIMMNR